MIPTNDTLHICDGKQLNEEQYARWMECSGYKRGYSDGKRQVMEWGDELCPHDCRTLPNRRKRACDKCWDELKKEVGK